METSEIIKNLMRGYLFTIDRSVRKHLNKQSIPVEMRAEFTKLGYMLEGAKVKRIIKGREWAIHGEHEFSVEQERNDIVVCDLGKIMTRKALADIANVSRQTIDRLCNGKTRFTYKIASAIVDTLWLNDEQVNVIMIAAARECYQENMVKLHREFSDYPAVVMAFKEDK